MNIAIVEDNKTDLKRLKTCVDEFFKEKNLTYSVSDFDSGLKFLDRASENFDLVFMDIELPDRDGMETAKALRQTNTSTIIVFVTNLAQFAVDGYLVDALDYIVKPVSYGGFKLRMERVLKRYNATRRNDKIFVKTDDGSAVLFVNDVRYVEVINHKVVYHTTSGKVESKDSLASVAKETEKFGFILCNRCYLVNLRHVRAVDADTVTVGDEKLLVSRAKRKELVRALAEYLSAGGENV